MASRYFYPAIPALVAASALGAKVLWTNPGKTYKLLVAFIIGIAIIQSVWITVSPLSAKYAPDDQSYLMSGDISAFGLDQVAQYMKGKTGLLGVTGVWGVADGSVVILNEQGIRASKVERLYAVTDEEYLFLTRFGDLDRLDPERFEIIFEYPRPKSPNSTYLIKVLPPKTNILPSVPAGF
jgi:hypothetical protein